MSRQSCETHEVYEFGRVTAADLEFGAPSPFDKIRALAKAALMLWGAVVFGAAVGTVGFYLVGAADAPSFISEAKSAIAAPAGSAADTTAVPATRIATSFEASGLMEPTSFSPPRQPQLAEIPPYLSDFVAPRNPLAVPDAETALPQLATAPVAPAQFSAQPAPTAKATKVAAPVAYAMLPATPADPKVRLPRSRPDEPVFTGSIAQPAEVKRVGICGALKRVHAGFMFRERCADGKLMR